MRPSKEIMPGDRVMVFDHLLFVDDVSTPITMTVKPATVVRRYGERVHYQCADRPWIYPDLCDVVFDHRPERESTAHFTYGIKLIETDSR